METEVLLSANDMLTNFSGPVLLKNKVLMAPGHWNDNDYEIKDIQEAYKNTDWHEKKNTELYLNHEDQEADKWIGYIKNPKYEKGRLLGDLEIWNPLIALYLTKAKAKFGISPKLKGTEIGGNLKHFVFENFSVVPNPAVKPYTYINLSEIKLNGGKMEEQENKETSEENKTEETEPENKPEKTGETVTEESKELAKKKEYPYPEKKGLAKKKKDEESKLAKKKKKPEEEEEEMSEEELEEITTMSEWTDYVKKMKKKDPKMGFKAIAKAYKSEKKTSDELEELSESELFEKLGQLTAILKRKKKDPEAEEEEAKEKKKEKDIGELKSEVKKLSAKLDEPDRKTVTLSGATESTNDPVTGMINFLQKNIGKGGGQLF